MEPSSTAIALQPGGGSEREGGLAAVERKGALQLMLGRPIVLAPLLGWALGALWLRARGHWDRESNARRVRRLLEDLGGIWIKVGQLLSLRADVIRD